MPAKPLRIEPGASTSTVFAARSSGTRAETGARPSVDAEPERELLVVPGRPHRHDDRLAADPDLERLLDRDDLDGVLAARKSPALDTPGAVRRCLGRPVAIHAVSVLAGRAGALPAARRAQVVMAQIANTVTDHAALVATTSRALAR